MSTGKRPLLGGKPNKPLDLINSLLRHKFHIVALGTFLFFLLAPSSLFLRKPYYEAVGKLRVDPVIPTLIPKRKNFPLLPIIEIMYAHRCIE